MRIALVSYTYSSTRGGVERVVWTLARTLAARGHEAHVVCHRQDSGADGDGIVVHEVPATTWSSALRYTSFARNAAAFLRSTTFDLVQGFGRTYVQDIVRVGGGSHWEYLLRTQPSMRSALGRAFRRWNPRDRAILALERRCFAPGGYRKVVCVSRRVRDEMKRYFNVPDSALIVIYNGVDTGRFTPGVREERRAAERARLGLKGDELAVLFAGTGFERKGLRYAVEAAARVMKDAPVRLLVAGRGPTGSYARLARRLGADDRVVFLGETGDIQGLYAASDVFVLPTLYDPFPNACLEAMACGVPVITTAVTGVAEIVEPGVDSLVVESGDCVADIADGLRTLLDPKRREAMGIAARRKAELHSLESNLAQNLALYEEVLALKRSGTPTVPDAAPACEGSETPEER
jgi:UDP-glucose:(heptosyl)LPS alpha-1,3-glucosyltransferase